MGVPDLGEKKVGVLDWGFESHWVPAFAGMTKKVRNDGCPGLGAV